MTTTRDCIDPWTYVEFRPDGAVAPCCVRGSVGNIREDVLARILDGPMIRKLRQDLLTGELDSICGNCHLRAPSTPKALQQRVAALLRSVVLPVGFEPVRYLAANADVAELGADPVEHFLRFGRFEGRDLAVGERAEDDAAASEPDLPTYAFDPEEYLLANPDLRSSELAPFEHFLRYGQFEGRRLRLPRSVVDG